MNVPVSVPVHPVPRTLASLAFLSVFERKGREPQQIAFLSRSMYEGVCFYFSAWTVVCNRRQTYVTKSKEKNLKFPIYLLV